MKDVDKPCRAALGVDAGLDEGRSIAMARGRVKGHALWRMRPPRGAVATLVRELRGAIMGRFWL